MLAGSSPSTRASDGVVGGLGVEEHERRCARLRVDARAAVDRGGHVCCRLAGDASRTAGSKERSRPLRTAARRRRGAAAVRDSGARQFPGEGSTLASGSVRQGARCARRRGGRSGRPRDRAPGRCAPTATTEERGAAVGDRLLGLAASSRQRTARRSSPARSSRWWPRPSTEPRTRSTMWRISTSLARLISSTGGPRGAPERPWRMRRAAGGPTTIPRGRSSVARKKPAEDRGDFRPELTSHGPRDGMSFVTLLHEYGPPTRRSGAPSPSMSPPPAIDS